MALLEWLFESAMGFAGIFGVFFLLLFLAAGIFFVGTFMVLIPGVLIEEFTHDRNFKLMPWRVVTLTVQSLVICELEVRDLEMAPDASLRWRQCLTISSVELALRYKG
jgi:tetrahydromethanopterin S-methyltransferase subunit D